MPDRGAAPPVLVSAAVLWRDGRVLLTRRMQGAHLAGLWEFPGGKVEPGEDPVDALVRECREECDVTVRVLGVREVTFHRHEDKDVLLLFYDCVLDAGDVRDVGVAEHVWCAPAALSSYPMPPPDGAVVAKIARDGAPVPAARVP